MQQEGRSRQRAYKILGTCFHYTSRVSLHGKFYGITRAIIQTRSPLLIQVTSFESVPSRTEKTSTTTLVSNGELQRVTKLTVMTEIVVDIVRSSDLRTIVWVDSAAAAERGACYTSSAVVKWKSTYIEYDCNNVVDHSRGPP